MTEEIDLTQPIVDALEDLKALDIRIVDVRGQTSVTDWLVIASGTSSRHVKSLANHVAQEMKVKY
ncbi:MAG: RsfS/YbeB/iojap family protein, partial [Pseudomonadota bacterium]|nr:RsfS/YbeB/iojap family protein [Pseudomonadota bacterium]